MRNELITCFQDTLQFSKCQLNENTMASIKSNKVYKENFVSKIARKNEQAIVRVYEGTTFDNAKNYCEFGRVAVLNFANPEYPGGGVANGAMAQEECLCRSSNLYACISDENVFEEYYGYHRGIDNYFYSDRLIYTKDVTVFKNDDIVPQLLPEDEWFKVDVITCAAPYIAKRKYTNRAALKSLFKSRIKNIFEAAIDNKVDVCVLGAFGCGAFKNPPIIVAKSFHEVIEENNYMSYFKHIVFAIKSTVNGDRFSVCPNISAFEEEFNGFSIEKMGKGFWANIVNSKEMEDVYTITVDEELLVGDIVELKVSHSIVEVKEKDYWVNESFGYSEYVGKEIDFSSEDLLVFTQESVDRIIKKTSSENRKKYYSKIENIMKKKEYRHWFENNPYKNKQFSIFGDSMSTLDGYNPKGYKVFYSGDNSVKSGVIEMKDTWWNKVISFFGGELLRNNSWSGSRVTKLPNHEGLFPSGCSDERTSLLHINDVKPDVIIVYLGTNDWAIGVLTGARISLLGEQDNEFFEYAYDNMLRKLKTNYPNSEIWCCTLSTSYISSRSNFSFPHTYGGTHIEVYNKIIRDVVKENECNLIDLYALNTPYDSIDGVHPTSDGMNTIAKMVINSMIETEEVQFLKCEAGHNTYLAAEENDDSVEENEYVRLNSNTTTVLYSDTIKLAIESSGKEVQFRKDVINVGQSTVSDLSFQDKKTISRMHATFYYENKTWFLKDNNSKNGTWLNGTLIQPGKKYQLAADDVIDLAHTEKLIFYKTKSEFEQSLNVESDNSDGSKREERVDNDLIGMTIEERYTVLNQLNNGAISKMYLVTDERLNKHWALKAYNKARNSNFDLIYQSIIREAQLVMKLDHPMIPRIVDIIENAEHIFIVREYVEGNELETIVKIQGPQSIDKVIDWGKQLCDVLTYLHTLSQPHIHRDIKPANIILMPDGRIKLIDFGIMRLYNPNKLADTCCLGTKGYAAPEQFGGRQTDVRTDIYGLGMTLHHLITGIDPKLSPYETKPIRQVNPSLPVGLEYIICKCVEFNPDDRYQNCVELKKDLDNYLNISPNKRSGILNKLFKR